MKSSFINQVYARFKAETPAFFRKVRRLGIGLAAISVGMRKIEGVPAMVLVITDNLLWIGLTMALVATLACTNPETLTRN